MDMLVRIKRLVIAGQVLFTEKAEDEMSADGLIPEIVYEAIRNAPAITKTLRSRSPISGKREMLYLNPRVSITQTASERVDQSQTATPLGTDTG